MGMAGLMSPTTGPINPVSGSLPTSPSGLAGGLSAGAVGAMGGTNTSPSLMGGGAPSARGGLLGGGSVSGSPNSASLLSNMTPQMSSGSPTGGTVNYSIAGNDGFGQQQQVQAYQQPNGQVALGTWTNPNNPSNPGAWIPETNAQIIQNWATSLNQPTSNFVNPTNAGQGNPDNGWTSATSLIPSSNASAGASTASQGAAQGLLGTGGVNKTSGAVSSGLAPAIGSTSTGTHSNSGGDINGTMATLPSTSPGYVNGTAVGSQSVPAIGYPTGYNIGQGVNTSPSSLLPNGAVTPTNLGVQQQVTAPSAQSVVQQNPLTGPTNWNVAANQTLSGQYAQLMQKGNPTIQAAEQQVIQANALHGGNNDLMAQTAATMQGSQLALQIGAQDAATYANAAQYNASAANAYASQLNQFTANAALSSQNFQQGVAMMNAQTNQQFQLMAAQINAGAYTTSINLNASLAQTQMSMNATMQTMDKQFTQNLALMQAQGSIASQQAYQQYGMNVRLGYLSSISQQQASLMQAIAAIQGNPNITSTQAQGAVQNAINEFNTFVTQMGAYASAMMPMGSSFPSSSSSSSSSSAAPVANSPVPTSTVDPSTWPSMGTPIHANTGTTTFMPPVSTSSGSYVPSPVNWSRSQTNPNAP